MSAIWVQAYGHPNYEVSSGGDIRRKGTDRAMKANPGKDGYLRIGLFLNNKRTTTAVHKVVAESFIGPKPENGQANHKDGDRLNNRSDNLEWVTASQNQLHSYYVGTKFTRPIVATNEETGEVMRFPSVSVAGTAFGVPRGAISSRLKSSRRLGPWLFSDPESVSPKEQV